MEKFFAKPSLMTIAYQIYNQVIFTCETGGNRYTYLIPQWMSNSFANEVIDILSEFVHDADTIGIIDNAIVIDWS